MTALPRSFGADVTDRIMRFAVGYPRDRLRDMVSATERIESRDDNSSLISWRNDGAILMVLISHRRRADSFARWELLDEDRVKYYGDVCDACEPAELQHQRTHF